MDKLISRFDATRDGDLMLCPHRGVAYARDMTVAVKYDEDYFKKCASYDGAIERRVNEGRAALIARHYQGRVLDVGIGAGQFVAFRPDTFGFDINPASIQWLRKRGRLAYSFSGFEAFSFWDTIEHCVVPQIYLKRVPLGGYVFISLPVFDDLGGIRRSHHYRPGEHFYYFTTQGFIEWMRFYGFRHLETSDCERQAGRVGIDAFAFCRDLPDYHELLAQYTELHQQRFYGASASLYLEYVLPVVRQLDPRSILDYGCGRSDLVAHFFNDGRRRIARYDPAISDFKAMPAEDFDLALCIDVMEHILISDVDRVFAELRARSQRVVFIISTRLARARLPNGENTHVTLLTKSEWLRWIEEAFGYARASPTRWEHVLFVQTFKDTDRCR